VLQLNRKYLYYTAGGLLLIMLFLAVKKSLANNSFIVPEGYNLASSNQVQIWVSNLEQAFYDIGTDFNTVKSVFNQVANDGQMAQLLKAFGFRPYSGGVFPYFFYSDMDLPMQMREELSGSEINEINNILSSKGITYLF